MDPFSPHDPLSRLLSRQRPVEVRPQFVQNVVRQARQTPQERGWWARIRELFAEGGLSLSRAAVCAAAIAVAAFVAVTVTIDDRPAGAPAVGTEVATVPAGKVEPLIPEPTFVDADVSPLPDVDDQWATMDQVDALLAVQDTSELTDREIAFLLY